jgi:hypothetical protein
MVSTRAGVPHNRGPHNATSNNVADNNLLAGDEDHNAVSYRWLDKGKTDPVDGNVYHEAVQLTTQGHTFQVRKGDAVLLFSDEHDWDAQWPCRIERMWAPIDPAQNFVDPDPRPVLFTARWFWHKGDLEQLPYNWEGSLTKEELVARMAADEVVLSNQFDTNEIATIEGPCYMTYRTTAKNRIRPPGARTHLPKNFQCQYKVDIMPGNSHVTLNCMTSRDSRFLTRFVTEDQRRAIKGQRQAIRDQQRRVQDGPKISHHRRRRK